MDLVLQDLDCVFISLEDILVASSSPAQHLRHLTDVFDRLEQHGLVIHPGKCVFGVTEITFLGHVVNTEGIIHANSSDSHPRFSPADNNQ